MVIDNLPEGKKCSKCGSAGPFHRNSRAKDGFHNQCVNCKRESDQKTQGIRQARYLEKHPEKRRETARKYKETHRDEIRAKNAKIVRDRYANDPEFAERQKEASRRQNARKKLIRTQGELLE